VNASVKLIEQVVPATVSIQASIPQQHHSAMLLGTERMGSGAIIDPTGYILTVNYIVIGATSIQVLLLDSTQHEAEIAAQDFTTGIAVLKISGGSFPPAPLSSSIDLAPGDEVFMVASSGEDGGRRVSGGAIMSAAPFDAYWEYATDRALICTAMNPGPGGGPMFDMKGRMVGITSLNLNEVGRFSLAIPVEHFLQHKDELIRYGRRVSQPSRAWIGMYSYTLRDHLVIAGLLPGGPGDAAGLKSGDVVLAVDNLDISDRRKFYEQLWTKRAGDTLLFRIFRTNGIRDVAVISGSVAQFFG
jgi:S1-C subfamily serine protease